MSVEQMVALGRARWRAFQAVTAGAAPQHVTCSGEAQRQLET